MIDTLYVARCTLHACSMYARGRSVVLSVGVDLIHIVCVYIYIYIYTVLEEACFRFRYQITLSHYHPSTLAHHHPSDRSVLVSSSTDYCYCYYCYWYCYCYYCYWYYYDTSVVTGTGVRLSLLVAGQTNAASTLYVTHPRG